MSFYLELSKAQGVLVVRWLGFSTLTAMAQVQCLLGNRDTRSSAAWREKKKKLNGIIFLV